MKNKEEQANGSKRDNRDSGKRNEIRICPRCGYDMLVDSVADLTNYCPDCGLNLSGGGEGGKE